MTFDGISQSLDLGKQLADLLKQAQHLLLGNKTAAEKQLAEVIDEIQKFYFVLNEEMNDFLSISFGEAKNESDNRRKLLALQNGLLSVRIENARGHCEKIKRIYHEHLETWFNEVFRSDNAKLEQIKSLFLELTEYDSRMLWATDQLSSYLTTKASEVLIFVRSGNLKSADELIWAVEGELSPQIISINALLTDLTAFKNNFSK